MKQVLILEDEKDIALFMKLNLKKQGFQVHIAHSIAEYKAIASKTPIDAAVLDLNLPDGNGFSIVPELRSRFDAIPITICSAYSNDLPLLEEEYNTKADKFIAKPMNLQDIKDLGDWLNQRLIA